ncbi:MAG: type II toxin-antitoxin system RelE/ParE family toxin [Anaerolineaceae bacterium]|nr:type II toxin-antitoxin system RelE/ParE family toxin [Anaerolineaceae bacterium]
MIEIHQTDIYHKWFVELRDRNAKMKILVRIRRISLENFGDVKSVGKGVSEIRIDYGLGYRIYFIKKGSTVIILLAGGTKSTQSKDIKLAQDIAYLLENEV